MGEPGSARRAEGSDGGKRTAAAWLDAQCLLAVCLCPAHFQQKTELLGSAGLAGFLTSEREILTSVFSLISVCLESETEQTLGSGASEKMTSTLSVPSLAPWPSARLASPKVSGNSDFGVKKACIQKTGGEGARKLERSGEQAL